MFFVYNNNKFKGESGESYRAIPEKISRMVEDRGGVKSIKSQIGLFYDNSKFYNGRIQLNIDDSDWEKELSGFLDKQQYKKNLPEFIRKKRMKDRIKLYKNNEFSEDNVDLVEKRVEELTKLLKKNKNIEKVWLVGKDHASLKLTDDKGIQINIEQDSWKEKLARLAGLRPEDLGIEVNDREYEGHVKTESSASDDEELTESVSEIEITKEEVEGLTPLQKAIYKIYKKSF